MSRYASELHHMRSAVKVMPVAVDIDNNDRYLGIVTVELKSVAEFNDNDAVVSDSNTAISTAFGGQENSNSHQHGYTACLNNIYFHLLVSSIRLN